MALLRAQSDHDPKPRQKAKRQRATGVRVSTFTQEDPGAQAANLYAYAGDDPINNVDPSGDDFFDDAGSVLSDVSTAASTGGDVLDAADVLAPVGAVLDGGGPCYPSRCSRN